MPEIAKLCQYAENNFVGAKVGIMDPFVSCMGKAGRALLLDCRSLQFQLIPIPAGLRLVVCNTMVKHDLATGTYNTRRAECEEGSAAVSQLGIPLFEPYAMYRWNFSIIISTIFPRPSPSAAPTSSAKTTAPSMRLGL